jgi:hypothetical protein
MSMSLSRDNMTTTDSAPSKSKISVIKNQILDDFREFMG